jgi:uncharacterized protein
MNIVIYGATGMLGSRIALEAARRGHLVTGAVRHPEEAQNRNPKMCLVKADATDADAVAKVAAGQEVVISAIGPDQTPGAEKVLPEAVRSLVKGVKRAGVDRLLVVGGAGSLEAAPGQMVMDTQQFPAAWKPVARAHFEALKALRGEHDLDWTFISPAGQVEPGTRTGKYRRGHDQLLVDEKGNSFISAEDYAVAVLDEVEKPRNVQQRFTVAY